MRLLFVLLVAALAASVQGQFRTDCPPANYTAITSTQNLAVLPPFGRYAICRPVGGGDTDPIPFTVSSGIFRLRNSHLIVDNEFSIVFEYPAYPDWADSAVTAFGPDQDPVGDNIWRGVSVEGAPSTDRRRSASKRSPYYYSHHIPTTGNCGRFNNVNINNVDNDMPSALFTRCDGRTSINRYTAFGGDVGMEFQDSNGVVAYDVSLSGTADMANQDYDGVLFSNSNVSLIRPFIFAFDDGVVVEEGSHITLCNPFISAAFSGGESAPIRMGSLGIMDDDAATEPPVSASVAGGTNLHFPTAVTFRNNAQGMVAILNHCPSKLAPSYSMKTWINFITP